jgi:pimeloyl-ACP methyl ester carboxylesterase
MRRVAAAAGGLVLLVAAALAALYQARNLESVELTDAVRAGVPGASVRLSQGVTHYEVAGPEGGQVVVLVHGSNVPAYIWDPAFGELARAGFRVLRYDRIGRGWSDRPRIAYEQPVYVAQLVELLHALGIDGPVDLAGLSLGGSIITSVAAAHPERVRSLVYVDPAFRRPRRLSFAQRTPAIAEFLLATFDASSVLDQASDFLHPEKHPDWDGRFREFMRFKGSRRAIVGDRIANASVDQGAEVAAVGRDARPVMIIWGRQDRVVPFSESDELRRAMPRAEFLAVDEAGHLPHIEQPGVVTPALVDFLRRAAAGQTGRAAAFRSGGGPAASRTRFARARKRSSLRSVSNAGSASIR